MSGRKRSRDRKLSFYFDSSRPMLAKAFNQSADPKHQKLIKLSE